MGINTGSVRTDIESEKNIMKRLLYILLAALILPLLTACAGGAENGGLKTTSDGRLLLTFPDVTGDVTLEVERVPVSSFKDFTIVRAEETERPIISAMQSVRDAFQNAGLAIALGTDWVKRGAEPPTDTKEILIGETNRAETPQSLGLCTDDYTIARVGSRIVLLGGSMTRTLEAVRLFTEYFFEPESGSVLLPVEPYIRRLPAAFVSFTVDGCELSDYTVVNRTGDSEAEQALVDFVGEMTGRGMAQDGERRIILDSGNPHGGAVVVIRKDGDDIRITACGEYAPSKAVRLFASQLIEQGGLSTFVRDQTASLRFTEEEIAITQEQIEGEMPRFLAAD